MKNKIRKTFGVLTTVLVAIAVVLAAALAGVRLVGLTPYAVLSGSMEPAYRVGSVIYIKKIEPENIAVGDPITFVMNEELTVATHRVVRVDADNSLFFTKGDANEAEDGAPVHFNNLLGKPVFTVPYLGYFSAWISSPPGLYIGITAGVIVLVLLFLPDMLKKADEADKKAAATASEKPGT